MEIYERYEQHRAACERIAAGTGGMRDDYKEMELFLDFVERQPLPPLTAPELMARMDRDVARYGAWPAGVRDAMLRGLRIQLDDAAGPLKPMAD